MKELRHIIRSAAPLTALEAITLCLALILVPYLLHVLGPVDFGRYAFGVAAGGALAMVVDFGFNQLGPKEVARAEQRGPERGNIFWRIQLAKLQLAIAAVPLLWLLLWWAGGGWVYRPVVLAAALSLASALLLPQWFLMGSQRYAALAGAQVIARVTGCVLTLIFVRTPADAPLAVLLQAATGCWAGLLVSANARYRKDIGHMQLPWASSWHALLRGLPLFASTLAISLYTICMPMVVGLATSPATLGLFGVADRIRAAAQGILGPIGAAAYPLFSVWIRDDRALGLAAARRMMALQMALGAAAAVSIMLSAEPLIRMVGGDAFLPAVPVAQILALCTVCTAVNNTLGVQIMLPLNMHGAYSTVLSVSAGLGTVLVWLLSQHWQAQGAATAVVATETLVAVLMWAWLRRRGIL